MEKFIVYLSTGERVCVEANYYEFVPETNSLRLCVKRGITTTIIAVFNFSNIQGICLEFANEEKEQKWKEKKGGKN